MALKIFMIRSDKEVVCAGFFFDFLAIGVFDDNGVYDYEYDYTDPTLAMDDDEAFLESVDEPELHEDAGSQQMSGHEQEYQDVISDGAKYQQSSDRLPPAEPAGNLLEDQDDLEFDPAFFGSLSSPR